MANLITQKHTRMRVKAYEAPLTGDKILGTGIDVIAMPDGHLSCNHCQGFRFEVWVGFDNNRIELGCMHCGESNRLLLPMELDLKTMFGPGRFTCFKHQDKGMVVIKNTDKLCLGCELCKTQVVLDLKSKSDLVIM